MNIALKIDAPIASFPTSRSREYRDTYPVPPPSTVYGMLLSLVGETDRYKHCGVKIAIAVLSEPTKSITLRTTRRFKTKKLEDPANSRPDFQEILTGVELIVWVNQGEKQGDLSLGDRLMQAFANPSSVNRFGALCLGESRDLVNSVNLITEMNLDLPLKYLIQDEYGDLTLPYWVDHVSSKYTRWLRYSLEERSQQNSPNSAWTIVKAT